MPGTFAMGEDRLDGIAIILYIQQPYQCTSFYAIDPGCRSGKSKLNVAPTPSSVASTLARPP